MDHKSKRFLNHDPHAQKPGRGHHPSGDRFPHERPEKGFNKNTISVIGVLFFKLKDPIQRKKPRFGGGLAFEWRDYQ